MPPKSGDGPPARQDGTVRDVTVERKLKLAVQKDKNDFYFVGGCTIADRK